MYVKSRLLPNGTHSCLRNFQRSPSRWLFPWTMGRVKSRNSVPISQAFTTQNFSFSRCLWEGGQEGGRLWWPCCVCLKRVKGGRGRVTEREKDLRDEFQFLSGATKTSYLLNRSHLFSSEIHFRLPTLGTLAPSLCLYAPTPVKPAK